MIDYHELNSSLLATRKSPLLVIYKEGTKTREELNKLHRLKSFTFYSEMADLLMNICGLHLGGIIVEEGADLSYYNFRYALTRLRTTDDTFIMQMDEAHKERLEDILEEYYEHADNKDLIDSLRNSLSFI